jgi:hypothetical protein
MVSIFELANSRAVGKPSFTALGKSRPLTGSYLPPHWFK